MRVSLIAAVARNGVIGRAGGLPWHISNDLKRFKALTLGKPVIMGRKTFQSIGRPLPGRANIVVSRDAGFRADGILVVGGIEEALARARPIAESEGAGEIMVIGGAEIYRQALPKASRLYVTEIHGKAEGDAVFPNFPSEEWKEVWRQDHGPEAADGPAYSFVILDRKRGQTP